jgi:hypothetical protein
MSTARAGIQGGVPTVKISPAQVKKILDDQPSEFEKLYEKCWEGDKYRGVSPGEQNIDVFLDAAKPDKGTTVADWGCGTGRAGYKLWKDHGMDVTLVDFASNCLDPKVEGATEEDDGIRFKKHDLSKPITLPTQFGICADVMEHVPEDQVDAVLSNILNNSRHVFFQIATGEDICGKHEDIDHELHCTQHDYHWWLQKLVDQTVIVLRSNELPGYCIFYVTGWGGGKLNWNGGQLNEDRDVLISNIRENAKLGIQNVTPHEQQDTEIMILGGGPSLNDFTDEIIAKRKAGVKLITTNGTYGWAIEHGLEPSMQLIIDGREFNKRFAEPILPKTKYCIASQCHPDLVKTLPKDRTYLWQINTDLEFMDVVKESYGEYLKDWFPCPGGSTVMLRGLCLLRMLGYSKFIIYGFDSCIRDEAHHAYEQKENDDRKIMDITVGKNTKFEKVFRCQPWMVFQAKEFQLMVPRVLMDADLQIKGDGMIAYIVNSGAELAAQE